jgi:NADH-quinone oxidoreductase subunit M
MSRHLLAWMVASPAVAAVVLLVVPSRMRQLVRWVSLAGAGGGLVASVLAALAWDRGLGGFQLAERYPLVPSMGISFSLAADGWSITLVLLTGIIIVTGVLASWTVERRDKEFFVLLLTLVTGVFGVFVSQDLFVFFLFYEIAVLPMYLLIGIWGSSHRVPPGRAVPGSVAAVRRSAAASTRR